jgi:hypothetical protein
LGMIGWATFGYFLTNKTKKIILIFLFTFIFLFYSAAIYHLAQRQDYFYGNGFQLVYSFLGAPLFIVWIILFIGWQIYILYILSNRTIATCFRER